MTLAIMQPYLFPYIGYFQLMQAAGEFVVYDNIQFTKRGWINRNRILVNGKDDFLTFPLKKDSDYLDVKERYLSDTWTTDREKILKKIGGVYRKAPFFNEILPIVEDVIFFEEKNLFSFILNSIESIKNYLRIKTPLIISSTIPIDHTLKSEQKVIEICKARKADTYLNPIGGVELYKRENFNREGLKLQFHKTTLIPYNQFNNDFVPFLSIIDVMMFNSREQIQKMLYSYTLK